ncbi:MAG: YggT family protein [Pseudomonadota bacterium]
MLALFIVLDAILGFYWWIIIASAVFSWLYAFNVVNSSNQFVGMIGNFLYQMTEPALRPIRRFMPNLGTIDLSPIVLLFGIMFLRIFLRTSIAPAFGVAY